MIPKPARYALLLTFFIGLLAFIVGGTFTAFGSLYHLDLATRLLLQAIGAIVIALGVGWITIGANPVLREVTATFRTMSRLESLSHPLLLRLSREAPGTFHHSLQVGALANQAARAVGADPLLARLGGYYHDIGKLEHPTNFIENQQRQENPLDTLTARKAALTIIAHVADGVKIADEYGLPAEVTAFIPEHVGTTYVRYFLEAARKTGKRNINDSDYQYPGPKPQSPEAAIVMLADSIEAKTRLLRAPSHQALVSLVTTTIAEKQSEDQLEFTGFRANDLERLTVAFVEALEPMHHQRIDYPTITKDSR